jgi:hypothetical protein
VAMGRVATELHAVVHSVFLADICHLGQ